MANEATGNEATTHIANQVRVEYKKCESGGSVGIYGTSEIN